MTQLEEARRGRITPLVKKLAKDEGVSARVLSRRLKDGTAVIPLNALRAGIRKPCAIGKGLRTKVNANIGTSTDAAAIKKEVEKLRVALACGADTVMDLSVGGNLKKVRAAIIASSPVPVGTVPVYEIAVRAESLKDDFLKFDDRLVFDVLEDQAREGVDFFTIHAGVTKKSTSSLRSSKRLMGIVSRGGAMLAAWMRRTGKENPFYAHFDRVVEICARYDVALSLGDGLRPGSIFDATDAAQLSELKILGELAKKARAKGVQVMIEGPGHVPLDQIEQNILLQKKYCNGAPFYVLGPLVTDVAAGYDHISGAIGAALAASFGADFLCYVTPAEHLRHPSASDVKEGVIASRIAAHAADIVKKIPSALAWDRQLSLARAKRDWKKQICLSIDPVKARLYRQSSKPKLSDVCTMCGKYCSIKLSGKT